MTTENLAQIVSRHLFAEEQQQQQSLCLYAVLDGASVPRLPHKLEHYEVEYECLYRGELEPDIASVAPYLVRLERDSEFVRWVLDKGWGRHWGIFVLTDADLRKLRRHFRTFLVVHDESGLPLYFRYYDPRVLRKFLPACNRKELRTMFAPGLCYFVEGEDPTTLLRFRLESDALQQEELVLAQTNQRVG
jgi:hypothetical protein